MNNWKVLSNSTGHLSRQQKDEHKLIEQTVTEQKKDELDRVKKGQLRDKEARAEYKRLLADLRDCGLIGNLDKGNLITYCNAWSTYIETQQKMDELERNPDLDADEMKYLIKLNEFYLKQNIDAKNTMSTFGNKLGLSISARMHDAAEKVKTQQDELEQRFGAI